MDGVTSNFAAHQINAACKKLTEEISSRKNVCIEIFSSIYKQGITGQGSLYGETFTADLYNPKSANESFKNWS